MSDKALQAMSYPALWNERARLEEELRGLRHTLDCVGHALDDEEYADLRRDEADLSGDLSLVTEEMAGRVTAGGAR